jgi:hypothetical protein
MLPRWCPVYRWRELNDYGTVRQVTLWEPGGTEPVPQLLSTNTSYTAGGVERSV